MAKEKSPAFQWYSKDFLADLAVMGMNMEERGCYITLMSVCWNENGLPTDATVLRRLCGGTEPSKTVMEKFIEQDGLLFHPRLIKERKKQKAWSKKQSKRAKDRWNKEKENKPTHSHGNAVAKPTQYSSSPTPSSPSSPSTSPLKSGSAKPKEEKEPEFKIIMFPNSNLSDAIVSRFPTALKKAPKCKNGSEIQKLYETLQSQYVGSKPRETIMAWILTSCIKDNPHAWLKKVLRGSDFPPGDDYMKKSSEIIKKWDNELGETG